MEKLLQATSRLEELTASGRVVPELNRQDIRELIVGEYRIVYRVGTGAVTILTVFRSSRLFPAPLPDDRSPEDGWRSLSVVLARKFGEAFIGSSWR